MASNRLSVSLTTLPLLQRAPISAFRSPRKACLLSNKHTLASLTSFWALFSFWRKDPWVESAEAKEDEWECTVLWREISRASESELKEWRESAWELERRPRDKGIGLNWFVQHRSGWDGMGWIMKGLKRRLTSGSVTAGHCSLMAWRMAWIERKRGEDEVQRGWMPSNRD